MQKLNNRIAQAFAGKKAFIAFLTAGDPDMESTIRYIKIMAGAGADLIEIGIPFSDPTAEGVVIQEANLRALKGGMDTDKAFEIVRRVRQENVTIPLVFMTYVNPVFFYGYDKFFARCEEVGVDGIILADMPFEESREAAVPAAAHNVSLISMIAPTSEDRIKTIASQAEGFIYIVSSLGVTGVRREITTDIGAMVRSLREMTDTPCAVGFGISTPKQAGDMAACSDGAIVGSAIVRIIARLGDKADGELEAYVRSMKEAVEQASGTR